MQSLRWILKISSVLVKVMEGFDAEGRQGGRKVGWMDDGWMIEQDKYQKERGIRDILEIIIELSLSNNRKK